MQILWNRSSGTPSFREKLHLNTQALVHSEQILLQALYLTLSLKGHQSSGKFIYTCRSPLHEGSHYMQKF